MSPPVAAEPPMIRMIGVQKHFGSLHVLRNINLEVVRGEVVVLLGPSGSGKSTLCRTINRLEPIDAGSIEIDGSPLPDEGRALVRLRADVGMVFQQFNLFPHKTIVENVKLAPVRVRRISKPEAHDTHSSCSPGSGSGSRPTSTRHSCPVVSNSGPRLPARWPCARR
jgi:glutamate transport system ATP-binding protein